jgi:hypothetical protein
MVAVFVRLIFVVAVCCGLLKVHAFGIERPVIG